MTLDQGKRPLETMMWAAGAVALCVWLATLSAVAGEPAPTAAGLLKRAHDGRAVWRNFPGFEAKIVASQDGERVEARLKVTSSGEVQLTDASGPLPAWVERTLRSVVGHRLSDDDPQPAAEFADNIVQHPLGRLIKTTDSGDKSLWRVKDDVLTEVHRYQEKSRFVISVTDVWRNPEGKHLPRSYTVTTWEQPSGQLLSTRQLANEWTRVGSFDLPHKLLAITSRSDGTRVSEAIELIELMLLSATTAAK